MRSIAISLFAAACVLSTAVWALNLPVTFPTKARVKVVGAVDEMGNLLFGSTPGKVEVTNFPATADPGDLFSVALQANLPPVIVTTVPLGQALIITDIDGSYACGFSACQLSDSTGVRLTWYVGGTDGQNLHHSYTTGVRFGPGETVTLSSTSNSPSGAFTFMGRLVSAP